MSSLEGKVLLADRCSIGKVLTNQGTLSQHPQKVSRAVDMIEVMRCPRHSQQSRWARQSRQKLRRTVATFLHWCGPHIPADLTCVPPPCAAGTIPCWDMMLPLRCHRAPPGRRAPQGKRSEPYRSEVQKEKPVTKIVRP